MNTLHRQRWKRRPRPISRKRPKIDEGLKTLTNDKLAVQTSSPVKGGAGIRFANDGVLEIIQLPELEHK